MRLAQLLILAIVFGGCAGLAHIRGDSGTETDCRETADSSPVQDQHVVGDASDTSDSAVVEDTADGGTDDAVAADGGGDDSFVASDDGAASDSHDSPDSGSPSDDAPVADGGGGDTIDTCTECLSATTETILAPGGMDYHGSTIGQPNNYVSACRPSASPEMVYRIVLTAPATVEADTLGSGYDTVLFLRSGCCDGPEVACNDDAPNGGGTSSIMVHLEAGTYYLFVDGFNGMFGLYTLNVRINP